MEPRITSEQRDELAREISFLKTRVESLKREVSDLSESKTLLEIEIASQKTLLKQVEEVEIENIKRILSVVKSVINE